MAAAETRVSSFQRPLPDAALMRIVEFAGSTAFSLSITCKAFKDATNEGHMERATVESWNRAHPWLHTILTREMLAMDSWKRTAAVCWLFRLAYQQSSHLLGSGPRSVPFPAASADVEAVKIFVNTWARQIATLASHNVGAGEPTMMATLSLLFLEVLRAAPRVRRRLLAGNPALYSDPARNVQSMWAEIPQIIWSSFDFFRVMLTNSKFAEVSFAQGAMTGVPYLSQLTVILPRVVSSLVECTMHSHPSTFDPLRDAAVQLLDVCATYKVAKAWLKGLYDPGLQLSADHVWDERDKERSIQLGQHIIQRYIRAIARESVWAKVEADLGVIVPEDGERWGGNFDGACSHVHASLCRLDPAVVESRTVAACSVVDPSYAAQEVLHAARRRELYAREELKMVGKGPAALHTRDEGHPQVSRHGWFADRPNDAVSGDEEGEGGDDEDEEDDEDPGGRFAPWDADFDGSHEESGDGSSHESSVISDRGLAWTPPALKMPTGLSWSHDMKIDQLWQSFCCTCVEREAVSISATAADVPMVRDWFLSSQISSKSTFLRCCPLGEACSPLHTELREWPQFDWGVGNTKKRKNRLIFLSTLIVWLRKVTLHPASKLSPLHMEMAKTALLQRSIAWMFSHLRFFTVAGLQAYQRGIILGRWKHDSALGEPLLSGADLLEKFGYECDSLGVHGVLNSCCVGQDLYGVIPASEVFDIDVVHACTQFVASVVDMVDVETHPRALNDLLEHVNKRWSKLDADAGPLFASTDIVHRLLRVFAAPPLNRFSALHATASDILSAALHFRPLLFRALQNVPSHAATFWSSAFAFVMNSLSSESPIAAVFLSGAGVEEHLRAIAEARPVMGPLLDVRNEQDLHAVETLMRMLHSFDKETKLSVSAAVSLNDAVRASSVADHSIDEAIGMARAALTGGEVDGRRAPVAMALAFNHYGQLSPIQHRYPPIFLPFVHYSHRIYNVARVIGTFLVSASVAAQYDEAYWHGKVSDCSFSVPPMQDADAAAVMLATDDKQATTIGRMIWSTLPAVGVDGKAAFALGGSSVECNPLPPLLAANGVLLPNVPQGSCFPAVSATVEIPEKFWQQLPMESEQCRNFMKAVDPVLSKIVEVGFAALAAEWQDDEGGPEANTAKRFSSFLAATIFGGYKLVDGTWEVDYPIPSSGTPPLRIPNPRYVRRLQPFYKFSIIDNREHSKLVSNAHKSECVAGLRRIERVVDTYAGIGIASSREYEWLQEAREQADADGERPVQAPDYAGFLEAIADNASVTSEFAASEAPPGWVYHEADGPHMSEVGLAASRQDKEGYDEDSFLDGEEDIGTEDSEGDDMFGEGQDDEEEDNSDDEGDGDENDDEVDEEGNADDGADGHHHHHHHDAGTELNDDVSVLDQDEVEGPAPASQLLIEAMQALSRIIYLRSYLQDHTAVEAVSESSMEHPLLFAARADDAGSRWGHLLSILAVILIRADVAANPRLQQDEQDWAVHRSYHEKDVKDFAFNEDEEENDDDRWYDDLLYAQEIPELATAAFELFGIMLRHLDLTLLNAAIDFVSLPVVVRMAMIRPHFQIEQSAIHNCFFALGEALTGRVPRLTGAIKDVCLSLPSWREDWFCTAKTCLFRVCEFNETYMQISLTINRMLQQLSIHRDWVFLDSACGGCKVIPRTSQDASTAVEVRGEHISIPQWLLNPPSARWARSGNELARDGGRSSSRSQWMLMFMGPGKLSWFDLLQKLTMGSVLDPRSYKHVIAADFTPQEWTSLISSHATLHKFARIQGAGVGAADRATREPLFQYLYSGLARCGGTFEAIRLGWVGGERSPPAEVAVPLHSIGEWQSHVLSGDSTLRQSLNAAVLKRAFHCGWRCGHKLPLALNTPNPDAAMIAQSALADLITVRLQEHSHHSNPDGCQLAQCITVMDELVELARTQAEQHVQYLSDMNPILPSADRALLTAVLRFGTSAKLREVFTECMELGHGVHMNEDINVRASEIITSACLLGLPPESELTVPTHLEPWMAFMHRLAAIIIEKRDGAVGDKTVKEISFATILGIMVSAIATIPSRRDLDSLLSSPPPTREYALAGFEAAAPQAFKLSVVSESDLFYADSSRDGRDIGTKVYHGRQWLASMLWLWRQLEAADATCAIPAEART